MNKGLGKGLGALIPTASHQAISKEHQPVVVSDFSALTKVSINKIIADPKQPRKHFDHVALEELMASIKAHGILNPLIITPADSMGKHQLIAGERRLRAAELLDLKSVPVIIREAKEQEKLELSLVENIQRRDLNPIEEALAYRRLMNEFNLTQEEAAKRLGKSRPSFANALRLLELQAEVQKAIGEGKISVGHAKILAGLNSLKEQAAYLNKILKNDLSVRDLEQETRLHRKSRNISGQSFDPVREAQEEMLRERLGTKVQIKKTGQKGQVVIHFYSMEELQRLLNDLT